MKATLRAHPFAGLLTLRPRDRLKAAVIVLSYLVIAAVLILTNRLGAFSTQANLGDYEVGQVAQHDLVSDRNLVYVDRAATAQRAAQAASAVPPVFNVDMGARDQAEKRYNHFAALLTSLYNNHASAGTAYAQIAKDFPNTYTLDQVRTLLDMSNLLTLLPIAATTVDEIMTRGVLARNAADFAQTPGSIKIVQVGGSGPNPEVVPLKSVITTGNLDAQMRTLLLANGLDVPSIPKVMLLAAPFIAQNAQYDYLATQKSRAQARATVEPVLRRITQGEKVVRKGFIITAADMDKIQALGASSKTMGAKSTIGTLLFVLLLYALAFTLLNRRVVSRRLQDKSVYLLTGLAVFYVAVSALLSGTPLIPEWLPFAVVLPTALVAMIVAILVEMRVGVIFSLLLSLSLFAISRTTPYSFLFAFFSGTVSTFLVSGAERRIDLIRASIELAGANSLILLIFGFFMNYEFSWFFIAVGWGALNGFLCGILNLGLLPIFEHLLNAPTPFRLMELSDMNSPMLKRMLTLAPGTYGHSVSVANLAESACRAIGANALLARVGAYYHDIGKIDQSEYFIENQTSGNVHDELKPSLSAAVIKSHVKIGIERAKELGLPQEVIDIIAQHHGSTLISYFYIQALKSQRDSKVSPEDFSYSGTPPTSREAAVVMLADTVEAASRTLKKPTVAKLERFIWSSIIEKFTSGQMNDSDITFRDLEVIKRTFLQILAGHFHSRIEYPDKNEAVR